MVSIWQHVLVILALLGTHGATVYWAVRRIRELQEALKTRDVLLNKDHPDGKQWNFLKETSFE